jgi:Rrf2 family protein
MHMIKIKNRGTKVHIFCSYDRSRVGTQAVRLTKFTDYSLRLLMYLAAAPERRATIAEVARAYAISEHHMVKVVHVLGKEGYLTNTRGRGGGVQLARPAREINVGRVVRATEGADRPAECFDTEHNGALYPRGPAHPRAEADRGAALARTLAKLSMALPCAAARGKNAPGLRLSPTSKSSRRAS